MSFGVPSYRRSSNFAVLFFRSRKTLLFVVFLGFCKIAFSRRCEGAKRPKQSYNLLCMRRLLRPYAKYAEILSLICSHETKGFVTHFVRSSQRRYKSPFCRTLSCFTGSYLVFTRFVGPADAPIVASFGINFRCSFSSVVPRTLLSSRPLGSIFAVRENWRGGRGSNPRPSDRQSDVLAN